MKREALDQTFLDKLYENGCSATVEVGDFPNQIGKRNRQHRACDDRCEAPPLDRLDRCTELCFCIQNNIVLFDQLLFQMANRTLVGFITLLERSVVRGFQKLKRLLEGIPCCYERLVDVAARRSS